MIHTIYVKTEIMIFVYCPFSGTLFSLELSPDAKLDGCFSVEPATGNVANGQRVPVCWVAEFEIRLFSTMYWLINMS